MLSVQKDCQDLQPPDYVRSVGKEQDITETIN